MQFGDTAECNSALRVERAFRVFQLFLPAPVVTLLDQFVGGGELGLRADPCLWIFFLAEEGAGAVEM